MGSKEGEGGVEKKGETDKKVIVERERIGIGGRGGTAGR